MSYTSTSTLPEGSSLTAVKDLIELLGYNKVPDGFKNPNRVGSYVWFAQLPDISFVGVELYIYKENNTIKVDTRTRMGRSYWDLEQQNKTIRYLRRFFGGTFVTDEGNNRYLLRECNEPSRLASELYVARWKFHNALILPVLFLNNRTNDADIAKEEPIGFAMIDNLNTRFFSNSTIIPYIIGVWEEYLRSSFLAFLHQGKCSSKVFRNARFRPDEYMNILAGEKTLVEQLSDSLSFQRPAVIDANFKLINDRIDIAGTLRMPYKRRKINLYDLIDSLVDERNAFVHKGNRTRYVTDDDIKKIIKDLEVASDRIYYMFGTVYNLILSKVF
ncbi:MAG: hypothetical protein K5663_03740 [Clostridiales bacterium]|nr:hypothetical protein [Clostridiales bacterium]